MNLQDIRELVDYNFWTNRRLLAMTAQVTADQLNAPSSHSFGTLQRTLVHTLDTEWGWRVFMQGGGFTPPLEAKDFPTVESIQTRWHQEENDWWAFIDTLTDADLNRKVSSKGNNGMVQEWVLWHLIYHVINHGGQHRSEVANLLTVYGQSPGEIDFTVYLSERKAANATYLTRA
ncbi:MAG: DinB family protein [Chloroflexi bacterium]|nr:DinB family protein [Chloroflexota bacterium]MCC6894405.1 DinB family protein [Anaerolineae bacterium]